MGEKMIIDLTKLNTNLSINIDEKVNIVDEWLVNTDIQKLDDVSFKGKIINEVDETYLLTGLLNGRMLLLDNLTLEEVWYPFSIEIEENYEISENILDILPILWQNILVEVPLKVVSNSTKDVTLKGDGWRLISEDEYNLEKNESPFSELNKLLEKGKE